MFPGKCRLYYRGSDSFGFGSNTDLLQEKEKGGLAVHALLAVDSEFFKNRFAQYRRRLCCHPLIRAEMVLNHGWLSAEDFSNLVTIAEMTPGADRCQCGDLCRHSSSRGAGGGFGHTRLYSSVLLNCLLPVFYLPALATFFSC